MVKRAIIILLILAVGALSVSCTNNYNENQKAESGSEVNMYMYIKTDKTVMTVELVKNTATETLISELKKGDIEIDMSDYGGFEKVGSIKSLPENDEHINAAPGDVMLYQGNKIVIFYGNNSWSYTRLGKIVGLNSGELKKLLGDGDLTITLSLNK